MVMNLSPATIRRLNRLPQVPHVWEGAKICLPTPISPEVSHQMVIWMDASEGTARSLETTEGGHEALVRGLLKAIEHPQGPFPQIRPQKVLVNDREAQFYLRGILRDLEIAVEYAPELPMVEHLFSRFEEFHQNQAPEILPVFDRLLRSAAEELWDVAPWQTLEDYQVLQIALNCWDTENLYATVLGMMGQEYGVLLYRSLESLRQFRQAACSNTPLEEMEKVFLAQDCIFCTFDIEEPIMSFPQRPATGAIKFTDVSYGSIHPFEGMRAVLDPEEILSAYTAIIALKRFFLKNKVKLATEPMTTINQKIRVALPDTIPANPKLVNVVVSTMPEIMREFQEMSDEDEAPDVLDDLIPEHSLIGTGAVSWDLLKILQPLVPNFDVELPKKPEGNGLPVIMLRTTRTKANKMMQAILAAGGIQGLAFEIPENAPIQFGILALQDGQLQLIGEFAHTQVDMLAERSPDGRCAFIVAEGATKKSLPGPPRNKDILAVLETRIMDLDDLMPD
jgi:hypothetical protein